MSRQVAAPVKFRHVILNEFAVLPVRSVLRLPPRDGIFSCWNLQTNSQNIFS
jgi:hypothetical protein